MVMVLPPAESGVVLGTGFDLSTAGLGRLYLLHFTYYIQAVPKSALTSFQMSAYGKCPVALPMARGGIKMSLKVPSTQTTLIL